MRVSGLSTLSSSREPEVVPLPPSHPALCGCLPCLLVLLLLPCCWCCCSQRISLYAHITGMAFEYSTLDQATTQVGGASLLSTTV